MRKAYGGVTLSNPAGPPPLRGYWEDKGRVEIDELMAIMVLVPLSQQQRAVRDFTRWRRQLEHRYHQKIVLVMYHPVEVLGEL